MLNLTKQIKKYLFLIPILFGVHDSLVAVNNPDQVILEGSAYKFTGSTSITASCSIIQDTYIILADEEGEVGATWACNPFDFDDCGVILDLCLNFGEDSVNTNEVYFVIHDLGSSSLQDNTCTLAYYDNSFIIGFKDNHLSIYKDGDTDNSLVPTILLDTNTIQDGEFHGFQFLYEQENHFLQLSFEDNIVLNYEVDLAISTSDIYFGVVGILCNNQDILRVTTADFSYDKISLPKCDELSGDFTIWGYLASDPSSGNFTVTSDAVVSKENKGVNIFLDRFNLVNVKHTFKVLIPPGSGDGDYWGFVFNFLSGAGFPYDSLNTYIFDWKRISQQAECGFSQEGMAVYKVNGQVSFDCDSSGNINPFWIHGTPSNIDWIDSIYGSDKGWEEGVVYTVDLVFKHDHALIYVNDNLYFEIADCFEPSRFGFYAFSQENVNFYDYSFELLPDFEIVKDTICQSETAIFNYFNQCDQGFEPTDLNSIIWDFGDGTVFEMTGAALDTQVLHNYQSAGVFSVSLTIENKYGCSNSVVNTIEVTPAFELDFGPDVTLCAGTPYFLNADTSIFNNIVRVWNDGTDDPYKIITTPGTYKCEVQIDACSSEDEIVIDYYPEIQLDVTTSSSCYQQDNGRVNIMITNATAPYLLSIQGGSFSTPEVFTTIDELETLSLAPGTYDLEVMDDHACTKEISFEITELASPDYELIPEDISCFGVSDGMLTILSNDTLLQFQLMGQNGISRHFSDLAEDLYVLRIIDQDGCEFQDFFEIEEPALLSIDLEDHYNIHLGDTLDLIPIVTPFDSLFYEWTPTQFVVCSDCSNTKAFPRQTQNIQLTVFNENGCSAFREIEINVEETPCIYIPNVFSPNGDGINDRLHIYSGDCENAIREIVNWTIYSRWGEIVFQAQHFLPSEYFQSWNGMFQGKHSLKSVYTYRCEIEYINGIRREFIGDVTLLR